MPDRRPTIVDVARRAGVSKSTVSLVLRASPLVRDGTRARVRAAMAEIGYVYNRSAASMRMANAGLVGVIINDLRNPFFAEFATSLQMALAGRGYATVLANTGETAETQAQVVAAMIEHGVAALVISPTYGGEAETFGPIARAGIPAMQVLRRASPDLDRFPFATPDYPEGGRLATEHLLRAGARKIAFVGGLEGRAVTRERMSGCLAVLAGAGSAPVLMTGRSTRAFGREAARRLAAEHPEVDAAVCFNDLVALGLMAGSAELGRRVGRDIRIAGFDDIEEAAETWPSLTSVHCGIAGFGAMIAETILGWLEGGVMPPPETRTPVRLIPRQSTGGA